MKNLILYLKYPGNRLTLHTNKVSKPFSNKSKSTNRQKPRKR